MHKDGKEQAEFHRAIEYLTYLVENLQYVVVKKAIQ